MDSKKLRKPRVREFCTLYNLPWKIGETVLYFTGLLYITEHMAMHTVLSLRVIYTFVIIAAVRMILKKIGRKN
jgi:hypothetical protein